MHYWLLTKALFRELFRSHIRILAMGLSYLTLFSIVPVLGLAATIIAAYDPDVTQRFLFLILSPLGGLAQFVVEYLLSFIEKISLKNIGYIGVGVAVVTWFSMLRMIEMATNEIWHLSPRPLRMRNFLFYGAFIIVSPLATSLATFAISLKESMALNVWLVELFDLAEPLNFMGYGSALLFLGIVFSGLYLLAPNTKVKLGHGFISGFLTAGAWLGLGYLFTNLLSLFSNFSLVYSSFSAVVILAFWLFLSWMVVLGGVQLTFLLHHPIFIKMDPEDFALSIQQQKSLLQYLHQTVLDHQKENGGLLLKELQQMIPLPWNALHLALMRLESVDLMYYKNRRYYAKELDGPFQGFESIEILPEVKDSKIKSVIEKLNSNKKQGAKNG